MYECGIRDYSLGGKFQTVGIEYQSVGAKYVKALSILAVRLILGLIANDLHQFSVFSYDVPSLATNAWTGAEAASSSSTFVASDLRLKFYCDRDMLMDFKSSRLSHV